jgi:hypothetical protein
MRVLPSQFRRLSEAQGSVQFPAVEEVRAAGGRAPKLASNRIGQAHYGQRLRGFSADRKASRVHGTIERTTGMLGVRSAAGYVRFIVSRSPATPFGARRVNAKNASSSPASCRSRKLGTAFRSPVTTLSPPLRGQRSRPAPSLPRRCFFAYPLDQRLLRSVRFRSRNRANSSPSTRCPRRSPALLRCHPISTPLQVACTFRIKAFNRLHRNKLASPDARLSFAPRGALFRFRPGSTLETRLRPAQLIVP